MFSRAELSGRGHLLSGTYLFVTTGSQGAVDQRAEVVDGDASQRAESCSCRSDPRWRHLKLFDLDTVPGCTRKRRQELHI